MLNQFTVIENNYNRRPDVVVFINGLVIAVIEIKNPSSESATLTAAYNQLQTYKSQIASLFRTNAVLVITDGLNARIGSLTADLERFMPWRTIDGKSIAPKGTPEMQVLIEGVFAKQRLLDLIQNFTVFGDYHQFHAVQKAVERTIQAIQSDRKVGVIWHTQGSGKSLLMAFYAGQLVRRPELQNPTIVVISDRNDLDNQLFSTFTMCRDLNSANTPASRKSGRPASYPQPCRWWSGVYYHPKICSCQRGNRLSHLERSPQCNCDCR